MLGAVVSTLGSDPQCSATHRRLQLSQWPCEASEPVLCGPEGHELCLATIAGCATLLGGCAPPSHVRCADGTCTSSTAACIEAAGSCIEGAMCADGSCSSSSCDR